MLVTGADEDVLERSRTIREMYPRGVDVAVEMTGAKHVIHEAGIWGSKRGGSRSARYLHSPALDAAEILGTAF